MNIFLLTAVSSAINETVELNKLGEYFIRRATQATSADTGALYKRGNRLELCAIAGQVESNQAALSHQRSAGNPGYVGVG